MLPFVLYVVLFACALTLTVKAARVRTLPAWRRYLPLALLLVAAAASLLRGVGVSGPAEFVAFPLNLVAIALAVSAIRAAGARPAATPS
ncbi:hypothetical protein AB0D99_30615 [Streptomyces sp. NPDC047971]|uniref:hypothetical protein n=1 Tax=Streptomyces sp. NPDC047971 TaxID=3154499 RepID=UPI00340FC4E5